MTSPDHDNSVVPPRTLSLPGYQRFVRSGGLMRCCLAALAQNRRPSSPGTEFQCPSCKAVIRVDPSGAWTWQPGATAEALRHFSSYG